MERFPCAVELMCARQVFAGLPSKEWSSDDRDRVQLYTSVSSQQKFVLFLLFNKLLDNCPNTYEINWKLNDFFFLLKSVAPSF